MAVSADDPARHQAPVPAWEHLCSHGRWRPHVFGNAICRRRDSVSSHLRHSIDVPSGGLTREIFALIFRRLARIRNAVNWRISSMLSYMSPSECRTRGRSTEAPRGNYSAPSRRGRSLPASCVLRPSAAPDAVLLTVLSHHRDDARAEGIRGASARQIALPPTPSRESHALARAGRGFSLTVIWRRYRSRYGNTAIHTRTGITHELRAARSG